MCVIVTNKHALLLIKRVKGGWGMGGDGLTTDTGRGFNCYIKGVGRV